MNDLILSVSRNKINLTEKEIKNFNHKEHCDFCKISIKNNPFIHEKDGKLYSSCSMCYYTEHLDAVISLEKGVIVFMPDIKQTDLNSLLRILWYTEYLYANAENKEEKEKYKDLCSNAKLLETLIYQRVEYSESYIAKGAENPSHLSNYISNMNDEDYEQRNKVMKYLRWKPDKKFFNKDLLYWFENDFSKYDLSNIKKLKDILKIK